MRAQKMLAEFGGEAFGDLAPAECRWCWWRGSVPGFRASATLRPELALDVEIFGDGFDDPVAAAHAPRSSSKLPGVISALAASGEESRRASASRRSRFRPARRHCAWLVRKNDIEQERPETRRWQNGRRCATPMVPAPRTATRRSGFIKQSRCGSYRECARQCRQAVRNRLLQLHAMDVQFVAAQ